ncbi:MAG: pyridoxal phosphate-dependent aminotransferase [Candidatus Micrarchaeota archaeon]|nr:pyridoxal phosphate-dependent aminotransferase [Candidatus Micrarchaeota archaeon]MDE1823849.1 pyridoxal phosphate-dependent aminotransferase [Candidatus Micrarchaeota archaeon]MDE1849461.1 pyridoxal phosphate-dependent aminotransferase [Candidatus Micrarchaeota archaeon]
MGISKRAEAVRESETIAIDAKAKRLLKEGFEVINFSIGEPDIGTPNNVKAKTIEAVRKDITKYSPAAGRLDLREAIAKKLKDDNSLDYPPEGIIVSSGAKQSLYSAIMATINPGDEVMIPRPYWVSYPEQVKLCGGVPVFADTGEGFMPSAESIRQKITRRTRMLILNSPNNPTGMVYGEKLLKEIAKIAVENGILVISDEIYEKFIYGSKHRSIASLGSDIKELTITINGVSKSHSMTGYRIGYAAASSEIVKAMARIQSHTSGPSSISQYAAVEALSGNKDSVERTRKIFERRRDMIAKGLSSIPGIRLAKPLGAFYAFPDITEAFARRFGRLQGQSMSRTFAEKLLDDQKVATIAGEAFGDDRCIRLSYALPEDKIDEGMARISRFVG